MRSIIILISYIFVFSQIKRKEQLYLIEKYSGILMIHFRSKAGIIKPYTYIRIPIGYLTIY